MNNDLQVLKSRDDHEPIVFSKIDGETEEFRLEKGAKCMWVGQDDEPFGTDRVRPRIEPWLTALCQSEHLSLLAGSGLSQAVYQIATHGDLPWMNPVKFTHFDKEINAEATRSAKAVGRKNGNIEDQMRIANEVLRGVEILAENDETLQPKATGLAEELQKALGDFAGSILEGENGLITSRDEDREQAFSYLVSFLMSFASRTGTRDRLQIFTTNYDRFIEAGAEAAGLYLLDRFVGSLAPIFRSSRLDIDMHYNPPGIRGEPRYLEGVAKFTKLHGSLDWLNTGKEIRRTGVPFGAKGIDPYLDAPGLKDAEAMRLMIYPNAAKDRETAAYPYVELFRDFAAAICRPNSTLVTYGYSFGDEHINRVIEDMLTIPSTHLVVISYGDPLGRIMGTYEKMGRPAQFTLMVGNHLGDFRTLVDNYLPKPAIDRTTMRMAELLKARWGAGHSDESDEHTKKTEDGSAPS